MACMLNYTSPDDNKASKSKSSKVPNGSNKVPIGSNKVPNGNSKVPNGSSKMPIGSSKVPIGSSKVPIGSSKVPDGSSKLPNISYIKDETSLACGTVQNKSPVDAKEHTKKPSPSAVSVKSASKQSAPKGNVPHSASIQDRVLSCMSP